MATPFTPIQLSTRSTPKRPRTAEPLERVRHSITPVGLQFPLSPSDCSRDGRRKSDEHIPEISGGGCAKVSDSCLELVVQSAGVPPDDAGASWWIQRVLALPPHRRTGWVLAQVIDEYASECRIADLLQKETFATRMRNAGLQSLVDTSMAPRNRCRAVGAAGQNITALLHESGQRSMLDAIKLSLKSYASGLRCWAAFVDAIGCCVHFPATETNAIRYCAMFGRVGTLTTYVQHLRWAHRFLRLRNEWHTDAVAQVVRDIKKSPAPPRLRLALQADAVRKIVKCAEKQGDWEMAAMVVVGRAFLFRMPSECIPLQSRGDHSEVTFEGNVFRIVLTLERRCCCEKSGKRLCAVHKVAPVIERARKNGGGRLFQASAQTFLRKLREIAAICEIANHDKLGTHALRRGMARDIIDAGGSLATLLRAGDWRNASFITYLRESQIEERTAADLIIEHSDSE